MILLSNWRAFALREGLSTVTVDKVCVGSTIRELLEFIIILLSDSSWFVLLGQWYHHTKHGEGFIVDRRGRRLGPKKPIEGLQGMWKIFGARSFGPIQISKQRFLLGWWLACEPQLRYCIIIGWSWLLTFAYIVHLLVGRRSYELSGHEHSYVLWSIFIFPVSHIQGYYALTTRDFKTAATNFLESISTFTSYELMTYQKLVEYTILTSIISLKRAELGAKVIKVSCFWISSYVNWLFRLFSPQNGIPFKRLYNRFR